ncbi:MAG: hypothetical protein WBC71_01235 [Salaquimonas sp.]
MRKLLVAVALVAMTSVNAFAAEMDFSVVDADADSVVTMEEAVAAGWEWSDEDFSAADVDGDGGLNAEEFAAAASK